MDKSTLKRTILITGIGIALKTSARYDFSYVDIAPKQDHYRGGSRKKGGKTKYQRS